MFAGKQQPSANYLQPKAADEHIEEDPEFPNASVASPPEKPHLGFRPWSKTPSESEDTVLRSGDSTFKIQKVLGNGSHGIVFRATTVRQGAQQGSQMNKSVVIKTLIAQDDPSTSSKKDSEDPYGIKFAFRHFQTERKIYEKYLVPAAKQLKKSGQLQMWPALHGYTELEEVGGPRDPSQQQLPVPALVLEEVEGPFFGSCRVLINEWEKVVQKSQNNSQPLSSDILESTSHLIEKLVTVFERLHRTAGINHRDLKPDNLVVRNVQESQSDLSVPRFTRDSEVVLIDFSISKPFQRRKHCSGILNGGSETLKEYTQTGTDTFGTEFFGTATKLPPNSRSGTPAYASAGMFVWEFHQPIPELSNRKYSLLSPGAFDLDSLSHVLLSMVLVAQRGNSDPHGNPHGKSFLPWFCLSGMRKLKELDFSNPSDSKVQEVFAAANSDWDKEKEHVEKRIQWEMENVGNSWRRGELEVDLRNYQQMDAERREILREALGLSPNSSSIPSSMTSDHILGRIMNLPVRLLTSGLVPKEVRDFMTLTRRLVFDPHHDAQGLIPAEKYEALRELMRAMRGESSAGARGKGGKGNEGKGLSRVESVGSMDSMPEVADEVNGASRLSVVSLDSRLGQKKINDKSLCSGPIRAVQTFFGRMKTGKK